MSSMRTHHFRIIRISMTVRRPIQRRDLLSDRDGRSVAACGECAAHNSLKARVVIAGTGEISATAGGTQTLAGMRFLGDQIFIRAGDTGEWTNHNPVEPHTVTFGTA